MKLNKKRIIILLFILLFLTMIVISSIRIVKYIKDNKENEKIKNELKNSIFIENNLNLNIKVSNELEKYKIDFETLKSKNKDTVAYLKVKNTDIDYIVVKGEDNTYYLRHNFDKKWNYSGWVFADYHNKFDETDKNIVIYGHNIKDTSMFGTLKNVLEKEWYENEENKYVVLVTENGTYYYQVFSIYSVEIEDYYINTIFNENEFEEFINTIKNRSIYDYGVEVSGEDKVLTLSSCISNGKKRVVLHAKLKYKID